MWRKNTLDEWTDRHKVKNISPPTMGQLNELFHSQLTQLHNSLCSDSLVVNSASDSLVVSSASDSLVVSSASDSLVVSSASDSLVLSSASDSLVVPQTH